MSCANGTALTAVEDPATIPKAYWSSVYQTGTCVDTMGGKANPLGIILFIVLAGSCILIGSKESFYLFLTLQTFGLYNLVDIAWVNPIGYVLQGLQYLMIWNVLGSKYKGSDYTLSSNKYYRLNTYLQQSEIAQNIALIAAFTLLSLVLLVLICVIAVRRKKQQEQKEEAREEVIFENM
jgi:heme exporter protein D